MPPPGPDPPVISRYDSGGLQALLPGVAQALGVPTGLPAVELPSASRVCVVLVDGLGDQLLDAARTQAPFLAARMDDHSPLTVGCPSTTATSLGSFGTGLPPGRHGLVGYEVLDPARGVLFNELRWDPAVDPRTWQPEATIFERLSEVGHRVISIGNPEFDGSGLNEAALRGGTFVGADQLSGGIEAAAAALREPGCVYLYTGVVDTAGHVFGCGSEEWRRALRSVDRALAGLARSLPAGALLVITADHGMTDVPHRDRVDLAERPDLMAGVRLFGGEPRCAQIYCDPGAAPGVADRFEQAFSGVAWVRTRAQAIADGWFGPVAPRVSPRIGDVLVAARGSFALVDSRTARPTLLRLIGQHGSLTRAEQLVPLLVEIL